MKGKFLLYCLCTKMALHQWFSHYLETACPRLITVIVESQVATGCLLKVRTVHLQSRRSRAARGRRSVLLAAGALGLLPPPSQPQPALAAAPGTLWGRRACRPGLWAGLRSCFCSSRKWSSLKSHTVWLSLVSAVRLKSGDMTLNIFPWHKIGRGQKL